IKGWGQTLYESFVDGDFTASPVWGGNTSSWTIQANSDAAAGASGSNTLRLNSSGAATVYLSSQITTWSDIQEWGFFVGRRAQAYTAANQMYIWLYANESNLTSATVDGYRLAIGDDSGGDEIRLEYIVNGAVSSTVISSSGSLTNGLTDIGFLVRVTRSATGGWALFTSTLPTTGGNGAIATAIPNSTNANVSQGTATHNTIVPTSNGYIGVAALHSSGANAIVTNEIDQIYFTATASATPSIAISNQHPTAANIAQGSTNNILGIYQLDITSANATLTGISVTTAGTYTSSDIQTNGFKFWTNIAANLTGATQLGTSQAAVNSGGTVAVSGQSFSISSSTTRYILVTADIAINATTSNTISLASTVFSNITFSSGNKTGTDPVAATNSMTIASCTPENVTSAAGTNGNTQSILSWVNATCQDEIMIVAATATNTATPTGDGTAYTANSIYASGTVIGNGFVVYKGSTSGQTITGLTNGTQYFFKIFTRRGTSWTSGVEVTATPAQVSSATDYFRSNVASGNWATASTWESSVDGNTWMTSTLVPNNNANTITIRNGHTIQVSASATIDQVIIENGGILNFNSTSIVVNDGTGDDIAIQSGGMLVYSNSSFSYNSGATVSIASNGVLRINVSGITAAGAAIHSGSHVYNNSSILEYNLTSQPSASGVTYFPNVNSNTIPIFRINQTLSGSIGGGSNTVINGVLQFANGVTTFGFTGAGTKTIRNGITTLGTTTVSLSGGALSVGDGNTGTAEIGGTGGNLTISPALSISSNCTASLSSNLILSSTLTLNGTLAIGSNTLTLNGPYLGGTVNNLTTTSSSNLVLNCTGTGPFTLPNFTAINNLTVNSASQVYNLNSSPTISGALTLTSGKLNIGGNTLTLAGTVSGMSASNCL
ncbi:MAG: beta strand repeat-containing protein, partial [Dolichospermum sp.]